ncbi:hypothetical protein CVT25_000722 [Psilocybe cyanescens]|uniref:Uncharacterized protein n=1 Tax=Psilocybe cyanescens TaxID=93625 RepID=A0A409XAY4_PSICY|nr:hypothetical protein CVT25_000722 [Psilocybe cyanescens]
MSDDASNNDASDTNHDINSADTNSNMTDSDHDNRRSGMKSPDGTQDVSGSDDNNNVPMRPTPRRMVGSIEAAVAADDDTFATTSSVSKSADDTMGNDTCATLSQACPSPLPGNVLLHHFIPGVATSGSNLTGPHSPSCAPITLDQSDAAPAATLGLGVSVEDPPCALDWPVPDQDIPMGSPPLSHHKLQGSSQTTGSILWGHAQGNNPNIADFANDIKNLISIIGKVHLYITADDPKL